VDESTKQLTRYLMKFKTSFFTLFTEQAAKSP